MNIDFKIDGEDQDLLLKSSDGKVFSISKERAIQSEAWKEMLELGTGTEQNEGKVIQLDETSDALQLFLSSLVSSKWVEINLSVDQVIEQLKISDKYQTSTAAFFIPCMASISKGQWTFNQILQVDYYSALLKLGSLKNMAAKQFITLGPLEEWKVETASKQINPVGLMDLIELKQAWCKKWNNLKRSSYCCSSTAPSECEAGWNKLFKSVIQMRAKHTQQMQIGGMCSFHANVLLDHYNRMMLELSSW